ncbi:MAG: hypothetical protein JWQ09_2858 [Segetibacter sp.]|nr:hypothetical protein [Segetibacter sp.]
MAISLKLLFYVSLTWIVLLTFINIIVMIVAGFEAGRMVANRYYETWFTGLSFIIVVSRVVGSYVIQRDKKHARDHT